MIPDPASQNMMAVTLLTDVSALAEQILVRPRGDVGERRRQCEELQLRLEAAIAMSAGAGRFLDNFAPLLLHAIDRALYRRAVCDDDGAVKWDGIIGCLMPHARADAGALLDSMREAG